MNKASRLKGAGYLASMISVVLLGVVAWQSASRDSALLACLVLGMLSSLIGMELRWRSHRIEQKQKDAGG